MRKILGITGPTGVGKSRLGMTLAEKMGTDIISADSAQIYIGMEIQKKRIAGDFALSLAASFISTGVLQILLYPFLAKYLSAEEYGIALTIMGVGNTISSAFGGSLNNARLLQNTTYENRKLQGDFPVLFAVFSIASAIAFGGYLTLTGAL